MKLYEEVWVTLTGKLIVYRWDRGYGDVYAQKQIKLTLIACGAEYLGSL